MGNAQSGYRFASEVNLALLDLERHHDDVCTVLPLAFSSPVDNRDILALSIRAPGNEPRRPVLITAGLHAREWATSDAVVEFAIKLIEAVDFDGPAASITYDESETGGVTYGPYVIDAETVQAIFDTFEIVVVPVVNPDGRDFSLKATTRTDQMWRKNRRDVREPGDGLGAECVGADLNRNFDIAWAHDDFYSDAAAVFADVSTKKCDPENFKGTDKGSEPETQNVQKLAEELRVEAFVDVHMSGRTILYPWAFERNQTTHPEQRFDDVQFNNLHGSTVTGRDGKLGTVYEEFVPPALLDRLVNGGDAMAAEILASAGPSPVAKLRSTYRVRQTLDEVAGNAPKTTFTGGCDDYVFSLQFKGRPQEPDDPAEPDEFECVAYTLEVGLAEGERPDNPFEDEFGFFPDIHQHYPKIRREVHAGLFGLLKFLANAG